MSSSEEAQERGKRKTLAVIWFTVFVDLIGFGVLIPVIPLLLGDPSSRYYLIAGQFTNSQGLILLGYLSAMWSIFVFLVAPIFGQLSDKYGRKKILAIALAGTALSYFLFALGIIWKNLPLLFFSRAFDGVTGSSIAVAQAAIADISRPENRSRNFGMIGAAFGIGFILGPFLGGKFSDPSVLSWFDATTPFWFAAILSTLNFFFILIFFSETLKEKNTQIKLTLGRAFSNIVRAVNLRQIRSLLLANFLVQGGFAFFGTFFSVFLIEKFNYSQGNIGDYFAYMGLWFVIAQIFILRFAARRWSECQILRYSLLGLSVFIGLQLLVPYAWMLFLITPFFAVANGLTQANLTAVVSRSADQNIQGEILGINSSVQSLAAAIPPILSGYLAATFLPESSILVATIIIFFGWLVFTIGYGKEIKCEWHADLE